MIFKKNRLELSERLKCGVGRGYSQNKLLKISGVTCLILAGILTVNTIKIIYKSSNVPSPAINVQSPQVLGTSDIRKADNSQNVQFIEYKVLKGDTLFNVSQKYNIQWTTLATLNNLKSPYTLKLGQVLKIPR